MKFVFSAFFDLKYLQGRHFDDGFDGYIWCIQAIWRKNILRLAKPQPFPTGLTTQISNATNITFHPDDLNNLQSPGTYFQNFIGQIHLGKGCYIGPNVGIITANHDPLDLDEHLEPQSVFLGDNCWVGMNATILPGTMLGPNTVVGAGAVVTKSFPQGNCVIAGNPAIIVKKLGTDDESNNEEQL